MAENQEPEVVVPTENEETNEPTTSNANDERQKCEDAMEPTELDQLLESANAKKLEANQQFAEGNYTKALEIYEEALELAPLKFKKERSIILSNCAAANIKLEKWDCAITNANESIELGSANEKALERRAFSYSQTDENLDKAIEDYKKLQEQFPTRHQYPQTIAQLEKRLAERNERMKEEMMDQLKNLGNMCLRPFG